MMLYAYAFGAGIVVGVGIGAYQTAIYLFVKPEKKKQGIHDDRPT